MSRFGGGYVDWAPVAEAIQDIVIELMKIEGPSAVASNGKMERCPK